MFRVVYTQPLSDIRQSSVGGIEKHVSSYIILWSYPLSFKNTPKCFRNIQLWRIWRQEKEEKTSLLPYWAKFFDFLVSMHGSIIKDNKSVHLQVERKIIKQTEDFICRHLFKGAREETALLGARNRYALRLADHQRSTPGCAGWDRQGTS